MGHGGERVGLRGLGWGAIPVAIAGGVLGAANVLDRWSLLGVPSLGDSFGDLRQITATSECLLDRPGSPDISAVIGAEALRPPPLPPQKWRAQLDRLIELTERPRVRILISAAAPVPPVAEPSFTLLRFRDDAHRDLVYVEQLDDARYLDDPAEIARYCDVLAELSAPERTVAETRAVLHRLHAQVS